MELDAERGCILITAKKSRSFVGCGILSRQWLESMAIPELPHPSGVFEGCRSLLVAST